jgi:hypothetical protein
MAVGGEARLLFWNSGCFGCSGRREDCFIALPHLTAEDVWVLGAEQCMWLTPRITTVGEKSLVHEPYVISSKSVRLVRIPTY